MNTRENDVLKTALVIQNAAVAKGFDWPDIQGVFAKVREEMDEVESAWRDGDVEHARHELGDLLFSVVNLARFLQVDSGLALEQANIKFSKRFALLEQALAAKNKKIENCSLEELDLVWEEVKKAMASSP